jgi:hypothetical protein
MCAVNSSELTPSGIAVFLSVYLAQEYSEELKSRLLINAVSTAEVYSIHWSGNIIINDEWMGFLKCYWLFEGTLLELGGDDERSNVG